MLSYINDIDFVAGAAAREKNLISKNSPAVSDRAAAAEFLISLKQGDL